MAEEEPKPLSYVPEVILKKRKSNEVLALRRKEQLEQRKLRFKRNKEGNIKLPDEFIKEYRARELDLIQMKHREKRKRPAPTSNLLFVVRIRGKNDMHEKTRKILYKLRLGRIFSAVFVKANEGNLEMLRKVEPFITYGYPNFKNVSDLIHKKGFARINRQRVPLTDNNIIEQALGKHGILCIEDMVHEIANIGPHFKEVTSFLWALDLNKPEGGVLKGKKTLYKDGGDTGNREDHINDLISKMN